MSTELVTVKDHASLLQKQSQNLAEWITGGIDPQALIRFALHGLNADEKLRACTPVSIYLALLSCAVSGVEPGPLKGEAFLIPRNNKHTVNGRDVYIAEAQFMIGWRGIKRQGFRAAINIVSNVVRERDDFDMDQGTAAFLRHKPALRNPGEIIGAYAYANIPRIDRPEIEWMNLDDLAKVRAAGANGPAWKAWPDQMMRKSPLRRLGKRVPLGDDYYRGSMLEDAHDTSGSEAAGVLDMFTDGKATRGLVQTTAEAMVLPERTQVQVPADTAPARGEPGPLPARNRAPRKEAAVTRGAESPPIDAKATERATPAAALVKADPTPASAPASDTASSRSTSSAPDTTEPAFDGASFDEVPAGEPQFAEEDPVDAEGTPPTAADYLESFIQWAAQYPTRADAIARDAEWKELFTSWLAACQTKADITTGQSRFQEWAKMFQRPLRADPTKGVVARHGDPQVNYLQTAVATRWKDVP